MVQGVERSSGSREPAERQPSMQAKRPGFLPNGSCTLHHHGFVVASISTVAEEFVSSISVQWDREIYA